MPLCKRYHDESHCFITIRSLEKIDNKQKENTKIYRILENISSKFSEYSHALLKDGDTFWEHHHLVMSFLGNVIIVQIQASIV
jgi:hypothetical protein